MTITKILAAIHEHRVSGRDVTTAKIFTGDVRFVLDSPMMIDNASADSTSSLPPFPPGCFMRLIGVEIYSDPDVPPGEVMIP